MYPLSSRMASARNRMKILGMKVRMPPTPATTPSTTREIIQSAVWIAVSPARITSDTTARAYSRPPFRKSPTAKVRKNTSAMMHRNTGTPQTGWVSTRSILSVPAAFFAL